jgi:hypothetical protein
MLGVATGSAGARPRACLPGTGLLVADSTLLEASGALRHATAAHGRSQQRPRAGSRRFASATSSRQGSLARGVRRARDPAPGPRPSRKRCAGGFPRSAVRANMRA